MIEMVNEEQKFIREDDRSLIEKVGTDMEKKFVFVMNSDWTSTQRERGGGGGGED